EPEHQDIALRDRFYGVGQLAKHALHGGAGHLPMERHSLRSLQDRRHLGQPRRRVSMEEADDRLPARLQAERGHGLEERQVGLARPARLDASTLREPVPVATGHRAQEKTLDDRRLSDPRLARHEYELTAAAAGAGEACRQLLELTAAADNGRG